MRSFNCSVRGNVPAGGRRQARPCSGVAILDLRCLVAVSLLALGGCAAPARVPVPPAPVEIPESTWWRVDNDIGAGMLAATGPARDYARGEMESWKSHVQRRTESDFIPWFTGYWTQQWLAIKVAWYKLGAPPGTDPAVSRLAAYLQEQYDERVLGPVARDIDPDVIRGRATMFYIQMLGEELQRIRQRYRVPQTQFDRRLQGIPAIALAPPPAHSVSLYQLVNADPIEELPAYVALTARFSRKAGGAGGGPSASRISPVAKRASEKMVARLGPGLGASAAAAAVGGVAGMVISLGVAGLGAVAHEKERPEIEAQLRESLNAGLDDMWRSLMDDAASGVMAGVLHIAGQIESGLAKSLAQPVELEALPQQFPLSGEEAVDDDREAPDGG